VFTSLTLLTCYQLANSRRCCGRLQCWAEKRAFPRLEALDNVVVGQQCLLNFRLFVGGVISTIMFPPLPYALTTFLQHLNPMCSLKYFSIPFFLSRALQLCPLGALLLSTILPEQRPCRHQCKILYFLVTELTLSRYVVWRMRCFTIMWHERKAPCELDKLHRWSNYPHLRKTYSC
jgi:hypothetical protein